MRSLLLFILVAGALSACKSAPDNSAATTASSSSASASPSASASAAAHGDGGSFFERLPRAPYLPSRSAPDNSPGPMAEVEPTVMMLRPQLNECYRTAAKTNPKLEGRAIYTVLIGVDGKPTEVGVKDQQGLEPGLVECGRKALLGAKFVAPPNGEPTTVNVPIAFKPPRDGGAPDASAGSLH